MQSVADKNTERITRHICLNVAEAQEVDLHAKPNPVFTAPTIKYLKSCLLVSESITLVAEKHTRIVFSKDEDAANLPAHPFLPHT